MTLLKQLIAEANGIYEPLTNADISKINKTNKLNGGKIVKAGKYALQVHQVPVGSQVKESESLKAVLDSEESDTDEIADIGSAITADKLDVGATVKIKGTSFDGQEGIIDSFGRDKKFVIVKLSDGKHSFHSADVISSEDDEDEDTDYDTEDTEQNSNIKKFYVAVYDSTRETSWIGKVTRENGGMWHEKAEQGKPDITWGKEHEKYMSPDDIVGLYHRKMPHSLKIEGPFYELEDAQEFIEDNWGEIRESEEMKLTHLVEELDTFHRNALKALNSVLRHINQVQAKENPPYSVAGERSLRKVYRAMYGALVDGDTGAFVKVWDKLSREEPDGFDEFANLLFDTVGAEDFPNFTKKLGLRKNKVTEALDSQGYHTSLRNPVFKQNDVLVAHGDPREYLHDESSNKKNTKVLSLVTFNKKSRAEEFAKQLNATIVKTPSGSYRLVSKKVSTKKPVQEAAHEGEKVYTDFNEWKKAVLASYPEIAHKLKLKGRVEGSTKSGRYQTISYEIPGEDRSYGVWYPNKDEGSVLFESTNIDEIILLGEDILSEADIKVQALKVATDLLGTLDVKKTEIEDEDVLKAREFSKKQLFSADGQRWFISLFQLGSGKRFARIIPPKDSGKNPFFIAPAKGQ